MIFNIHNYCKNHRTTSLGNARISYKTIISQNDLTLAYDDIQSLRPVSMKVNGAVVALGHSA